MSLLHHLFENQLAFHKYCSTCTLLWKGIAKRSGLSIRFSIFETIN